jgi:hypothetical protein
LGAPFRRGEIRAHPLLTLLFVDPRGELSCNRFSFWRRNGVLGVFVFGALALCLSEGHAAPAPRQSRVQSRPGASQAGGPLARATLAQLHASFRNSCRAPNASFLSRLDVPSELRRSSLEDLWGTLAGDEVSSRAASRWGSVLKERESRTQQGLWSRDQDLLLHARVSSEGTTTLLQDLRVAQESQRSEDLQEAVERVRNQHPGAVVPLQVIAVAATVTTGQPVTARLGGAGKLVARTSLPQRSAQLRMETPWVDSDLKVNGREVLAPLDERYRVELSRPIPGLKAQGSVGYGGSTTQVTTALRTQISPSWLCVLDSTRPLDPTRSALPADQRIRFEYGIHF